MSTVSTIPKYMPTIKTNYDVPDNPQNSRNCNGVIPVSEREMKSEQNRLESFNHVNWKCQFMDRSALAKAGFYYFGEDDHVRCAFCRVEIGRWEQGDDPMADHMRWAPNCSFLKGNNVGNIPINSDEALHTEQPRSYDTCGMMEMRPNSFPVNTDIDKTNGIIQNGPMHHQYCTIESRLRSFKEWSRQLKQTPEKLAEAGFFYTGKSDQTICFHCDGGLKDWEENDDPWEQHAKWFSKCTYVLANKGHDFVKRVCSENPAVLYSGELNEVIKSTKNPASITQPSSSVDEVTTSVPSTTTTLSSQSPISLEDNSTRMCLICCQEERRIAYFPCSHMVACSKCGPVMTNCPLCRQKIDYSVRVILG